MKKKKFNSIPFLVIAFFIFLGIYLYPYVSDRWNAYRNKQLIVEYQQMVEISDEDHIDKYDEEYEKAVEYNKELAEMLDRKPATVSKLCSNITQPTLPTLVKIV